MNERIQTDRLLLSPITAAERDDMVAIFKDDCVKKTYMLPDLPTRADEDKVFWTFARLSCDERRYVRGIFRDNKLIGWINEVHVQGSEIELGYVIAPAEQNKGYATEALRASIDALFARGCTAVIAGAFEENPASMRVMEKAGMKKSERTEEIEYRGKKHKCVIYKIEK